MDTLIEKIVLNFKSVNYECGMMVYKIDDDWVEEPEFRPQLIKKLGIPNSSLKIEVHNIGHLSIQVTMS